MRQRGSVLVMTLSVTILLVSVAGGFLYAAGIFIANSGWEETDAQLFWLAEAALHKAIWNLKSPTGSGGQGEGWTTAGTTESLGAGSYTMVVERWDFALAANGATATASSSAAGAGPDRAIDGNDNSRWRSQGVPSASSPQTITITFSYPLAINKVRFFVASQFDENGPKDYTWQVSSDGSSFTTVVTVTGNEQTDRTDTFSAATDVSALRLSVTATGGDKRVHIGTLETIGARVTATGTITATGQDYTRQVRQTLVADDGSPQSQVAYIQSDWTEL